MIPKHRIVTTAFANVYPYYVAKAEKKGRTKAEVDAVICWLTGYTPKQFEKQLKLQADFETFFAEAPKMNPARALIKGVVCGVRVENIPEPTMREIRYLDKLVDELAKGKAMEKIRRAGVKAADGLTTEHTEYTEINPPISSKSSGVGHQETHQTHESENQSSSAVLPQRIRDAGLVGKPIETIIDHIEYDEGRDPVATRAWDSV